ncbi:hypothetical protein M798_00295 [Brucella melitensis ADMAS-G1]|nr:hypothetical protein M798_00295 [Brucella melitensis ADMAS-G1]
MLEFLVMSVFSLPLFHNNVYTYYGNSKEKNAHGGKLLKERRYVIR